MPDEKKKRDYLGDWRLSTVLSQAADAAQSKPPATPKSAPSSRPDQDDRSWIEKAGDWLVDIADPKGAAQRAQTRRQTRRYRAPNN
jgi:hypothetical protein